MHANGGFLSEDRPKDGEMPQPPVMGSHRMTDDWWPEHEMRTHEQPSRAGLGRMAEALEAGAMVVEARLLRGGIINSTHAIDIRMSDGAMKRFVLKRFLFSAEGARRAWDGLELAQRAPVAAPEPVLFDEAGEWFGEPSMLLTFLPGHTRIPVDPGNLPELLGETLANIHRGDVGDQIAVPPERFWPRSTAGSDGLLANVLGAVARGLSRMDSCVSTLIHRDFWMGNVLWRQGRVSGVVDWSESSAGPRGYDVGYARVDIEIVWGDEAAARFTDAYSRRAGPVPDLRTWDLICGYDALESAVWWMRGYHAVGRRDIDLGQIEARLSRFLRTSLDGE